MPTGEGSFLLRILIAYLPAAVGGQADEQLVRVRHHLLDEHRLVVLLAVRA